MWIRLLEFADWLRHRVRTRRETQDRATGKRGEDLAQRFLQRAGVVVVARNYRLESGAGEIDLVGWEAGQLVFVEVKTRATDEFGAPERAIGPAKKRLLIRAARDFARRADVPWEKVRFDVVGVLLRTPVEITHTRDVLPAIRDPIPRLTV